jgi:hypothetical protein
MLCLEIPDSLQAKIAAMASLAQQTPEQLALDLLEEQLDHHSAYVETAYLSRSPANCARLNQAIRDIRQGCFEERALIDD